MSVLDQNKSFVTGILNDPNVNFDLYVFGLWATVFDNLNSSPNGYIYPRPIIQDITTVDYVITGKVFSFYNFDGKYPDAKFFITSGTKGVENYADTQIAADISTSFVSGYKPLIIMPDMDHAGKLYRRQEITGLTKSIVGNYDVLNLSGEDWIQTNISVNSNNTDREYGYYDYQYSGYSNEVATRYKFLYDDESNSETQNISLFEPSVTIEDGTRIKYRICRKSNPLGSYYIPEVTEDGKILIDYSQFQDEVSSVAASRVSYQFNTLDKLVFPKGVFDNLEDNQSVIRPINDSTITGIELFRSVKDNEDEFNFRILPTGNFSDIYRLSFNLDRYNATSKTDVTGYLLTGVNTGNGSSAIVYHVTTASGVYPRVLPYSKFNTNQLLELANVDDLIYSEEYAQEAAANVDYGDESNLVKNLKQDVSSRLDLMNQLLQDDPFSNPNLGSLNSEDVTRRWVDDKEIQDLNNSNSQGIIEKFTLPVLPLPKESVEESYYSNYLNSGENYIAIPLNSYNSNINYIYYGDGYGQLGYYIDEYNDKFYRTIVNSTCGGVYINKTGLCVGDTAVYASMPYIDGIYFLNGIDTAIPANGVITKSNYITTDRWTDNLNYYYVKNYISSCDIFPTDSINARQVALSKALGNAYGLVGKGSGDFISQDPQGEKTPIVFVEREIYVESYDKDQIGLLNNILDTGFNSFANVELSDTPQEKLYAVQVFDKDFAARDDKSVFYFKSHDYQENIIFDSFISRKNSNGDTVLTYGTGDSYGTVYSTDTKLNANQMYRLEYVTGNAFSYNGLSDFIAWNGVQNNTISLTNQNERDYSYHLYEYTLNTDQLTLVKANVKNAETASTSLSKAVVLKFIKKGFGYKTYLITVNGIEYRAIDTSVVDSSNNLVDESKVFFNLQKYNYSATPSISSISWFTHKQNPINDDNYGANDSFGLTIPRFFQDAPEEKKSIGEILLNLPNGPTTSKNYEGTPIKGGDVNSFADGVLNNTLVIKEARSNYEVENDYVLNFTQDDGNLFKENLIVGGVNNFSRTRRLKITKVKYNFYVKDLVILGDSGFPYSIEQNDGWEYKLQYKKKTSTSWSEIPNSEELTNEIIGSVSSFLSPYSYKLKDTSTPNYLSLIAFRTNLSRFLNDSDYEFRVFKYEKLHSPFETVDIIRKVNFLPIQVNWNWDNKSKYFNIYQVDSGNNYRLLNTETVNNNTSFVIPNVKQQYFDLGLANFPVNGSGYYNIIVSGALPTTQEASVNASTLFNNNAIGNDGSDFPMTVNTIQNTNYQSGYNLLAGTTYSPLIQFDNKESKQSNFTINSNYSGYYFITDSKSASITSAFDGLEFYVANTGSTSCSLSDSVNGGSTSISSNYVGVVANYPSKTTSAISSLPSLTAEVENGGFLYLTANASINPGDFSLGVLKTFTATIINNSSSSITISYSSASISIAANQTKKIDFSNGWNSSYNPTVVENTNYSNVECQVSYISSDEDLVNFNHSLLELKPKSYSNLGIYNFSKDPLSINGDVDLDPDSFNLVSWDGSAAAPTVNKKNYFDSIKIFLKGTESEPNNIFVLKDDTEIIISHFGADNSNQQPVEYFFLKDDSINRSLNLKIKNGANEYFLPRGSEDFKLTVTKDSKGIISEKILFPSSDFSTVITDDKEQLIVVKTPSSKIDVGYIESALKSTSFVYFINKSTTPLEFSRNLTQTVFSLAHNKIARVVLEKGSGRASIVEISEAYNHLFFNIDPSIYLTGASGINLLNLKFCSAELEIPAASNFADSGTFLINKNRFAPNLIENTAVKQEQDLLENKLIKGNSKILKLYRKNSSDTTPTLARLEVDQINLNSVFGEKTSSAFGYYDSDSTFHEFDVFYIRDTGLKNLTVSDFYNREGAYSGKIICSTSRNLQLLSFDENKETPVFDKGDSFNFKFDQGTSPDGSIIFNKIDGDVQIFNEQNQNNALKTLTELKAGHLCANFSYDRVRLTTEAVDLCKNRIINNSLATNPIYNDKEFFIASSKEQIVRDYFVEGENSYFYQITYSTDIDSIILPDANGIASKFIFLNSGSRPIDLRLISSTGKLITLEPNDNKTLSVSASAWNYADYNSASDGEIPIGGGLNVLYENQNLEIESNHVFKSLWQNQGYSKSSQSISDSIIQAFTPLEKVEKTFIDLEDLNYSIVDLGQDLNINANTNSEVADEPFIFCFGRKGPDLQISENISYILNDFYLYLKCSSGGESNDQTILLKEHIWGNEFIRRKTDDLPKKPNIITRTHVDIGSFFEGRYQKINIEELGSLFLIPFYRECVTFYLPNLKASVLVNEDRFNLGELLEGKKFVFLNLVKNNINSPNQIYNYSDTATNTNLTEVNSVCVFYVYLNGANYEWKKQTVALPKVQNCFAELKNLKGVSLEACSNVTSGNEFVYLPNFNTFKISLDSFQNKQFQNFYLYNSCNYPLSIIFNNSSVLKLSSSSAPFNRVSFNGSSFTINPIVYNSSTNFIESEILQVPKSDQLIGTANISFPKPAENSYLKLNYYQSDIRTQRYFSLLKANDGQWSPVDTKGIENYAFLNLFDLETYDLNSKLFIYGSSVRNQNGYVFDQYELRLTGCDIITESFFFFNNTLGVLKIYFDDSAYSLSLDPLRLAVIYKESGILKFKYCESHQTSKFYISYRNKNINFLLNKNISLFVDACQTIDVKSLSVIENESNSVDSNVLLTLHSGKFASCYFNHSFLTDLKPSFLPGVNFISSLSVYSFPVISSFGSRDWYSSPTVLLKPNYKLTSHGHYIITNQESTISLTPYSNNTFLVNNTASDILVKTPDYNVPLYHNTVLVINNSSFRYLKKAKNKDETYAVFNPKTLISTQREVSLVLGIEQHQEILPVSNIDFVQTQSYLKLYSKNNQSETIFLNFENYYKGAEIPNDCPQNILAYELGIGHETIYKFLFFDPSSNYYTLPGIKEGTEYVVEINEGLFYNLFLGDKINDSTISFGSVRYMGKKYYNGQSFIGGKSFWYEIDYPNYVRVSKVVREIPEGFVADPKSQTEEGLADLTVIETENSDKLAGFKDFIFSNIGSSLSLKYGEVASLCWIPDNQNAFWLESNFNKDIWSIQTIFPDSTVKLTFQENGETKELSFVKCAFKKGILKSPILNYGYTFYSALQEKLAMSDTGEITTAFDYGLTPSQKNKFKSSVINKYYVDDYLYSDKAFVFGSLPRNGLLQIDTDTPSQLKSSTFDITISLEKMSSMPTLNVEDFNNDSAVQILNQDYE